MDAPQCAPPPDEQSPHPRRAECPAPCRGRCTSRQWQRSQHTARACRRRAWAGRSAQTGHRGLPSKSGRLKPSPGTTSLPNSAIRGNCSVPDRWRSAEQAAPQRERYANCARSRPRTARQPAARKRRQSSQAFLLARLQFSCRAKLPAAAPAQMQPQPARRRAAAMRQT